MAYTIDGCDPALVGYVFDGSDLRAVYNEDLLVECFVDQGMSHDEAVEWLEFNVKGAHLGAGTPLVMTPADVEEFETVAQGELE